MSQEKSPKITKLTASERTHFTFYRETSDGIGLDGEVLRPSKKASIIYGLPRAWNFSNPKRVMCGLPQTVKLLITEQRYKKLIETYKKIGEKVICNSGKVILEVEPLTTLKEASSSIDDLTQQIVLYCSVELRREKVERYSNSLAGDLQRHNVNNLVDFLISNSYVRYRNCLSSDFYNNVKSIRLIVAPSDYKQLVEEKRENPDLIGRIALKFEPFFVGKIVEKKPHYSIL